MIYRSPNSIGSLFFNCPIRRTVTVKTCNIYKKQHGAQPCVEKMQFIFFVPPNEELEGTLHPKNEGKRVHVPPKMKVKGYMYPQMKKPVGMLYFKQWNAQLHSYCFNRRRDIDVKVLSIKRYLFEMTEGTTRKT
jgi:hypothetical protein